MWCGLPGCARVGRWAAVFAGGPRPWHGVSGGWICGRWPTCLLGAGTWLVGGPAGGVGSLRGVLLAMVLVPVLALGLGPLGDLVSVAVVSWWCLVALVVATVWRWSTGWRPVAGSGRGALGWQWWQVVGVNVIDGARGAA